MKEFIEQSQLPESSKLFLDKKVVKRQKQQRDRLLRLGATEKTLSEITGVLDYLDSTEFSKTIPAREELYKRLVGIARGKSTPLVVFNCLNFRWDEVSGQYPSATVLDDTSTSICEYFIDEIKNISDALNSLSPNQSSSVDLCIIVPDSELFDARVFPFTQSTDERINIGSRVKRELAQSLDTLSQNGRSPVMYWSEYCIRYGLISPTEYTSLNAERLLAADISGRSDSREKNIAITLGKQIADSGQYLINNGLSPGYVTYDIPKKQRNEKTLWYCAMYMGEGQALADSGALSLNLEDLRVKIGSILEHMRDFLSLHR